MTGSVRHFINVIAAFAFYSVLMASCGDHSRQNLTKAQEILEERPDSAYVILKDIDFKSLDSEKDKAAYILTHARANLYLGRSLIADTLLPAAMRYYSSIGDTSSFIDASISQSHHLRSIEKKEEAFALLDSLSSAMPGPIRRQLNQELLGFSFEDNATEKALEIIDRQIQHAYDNHEKFIFELKKITPLIMSGRAGDAVALCDSLATSPVAPEAGSREWFSLMINYASALGERRETAPEAAAILEDLIDRTGKVPESELIELYIPMVNLQMNAGNAVKATAYLKKIENTGITTEDMDPVAAAYLVFLKMALDYETYGSLSLTGMSNIARSLRKVSNDLEIKRQERDDALETAYDLSRNNYELTIRHQRMWLIVILILLICSFIIFAVTYISHRRRNRLIAAEERIDTLEGLLKSVGDTATDRKQRLLKRLLLQQLGIIKTFAESPTAQNQDALRKISNIGNSDTPIDTLVRWEDLYPVIDELYEGFHEILLNRYNNLFSEREIQILCLIRAEFSTKEIGVLIQQTSNSIYVSKTAIRKKLGLPPKEDFMSVLTVCQES